MSEQGRAAGPPLRADAERNRLAILRAAEELFATDGTEVSLERIAHRAGVGVGTIYRRFPSLKLLRDVVFERMMTLYADRTEQAAVDAEREPWPAFASWVRFVLDQQARNKAFSDAILTATRGSAVFRAEVDRALAASRVLVETVTAAGVVRDDFDHTDLRLLQLAGAGIVAHTRRSAVVASQRFAQYMLDAFRATGEQLPAPPPRWVHAENQD